MVQCGAAMIVPRRGSIFPRITGLHSCKKWNRDFFYVRNTGKADLIGLPAFSNVMPVEQHNWEFNPRNKYSEFNKIHKLVKVLVEDGLVPNDLLGTYIRNRISPLQHRSHKICHMSGSMILTGSPPSSSPTTRS